MFSDILYGKQLSSMVLDSGKEDESRIGSMPLNIIQTFSVEIQNIKGKKELGKAKTYLLPICSSPLILVLLSWSGPGSDPFPPRVPSETYSSRNILGLNIFNYS